MLCVMASTAVDSRHGSVYEDVTVILSITRSVIVSYNQAIYCSDSGSRGSADANPEITSSVPISVVAGVTVHDPSPQPYDRFPYESVMI